MYMYIAVFVFRTSFSVHWKEVNLHIEFAKDPLSGKKRKDGGLLTSTYTKDIHVHIPCTTKVKLPTTNENVKIETAHLYI